MPTLLLLGANSDIGRACAVQFAAAGFDLLLTTKEATLARATTFAEQLQRELNIEVQCLLFDALDLGSHHRFHESLAVLPDVVLSAVGFLGDPASTPDKPEEGIKVLNTNFTGLVSILDRLAKDMRTRGSGHIIGISSVAGERGRASNYHYGSAKAGFTAYLSGLRQALASHNVHVSTILPGFVATKMLGNRETPPFLTATPDEVADRVYSAYRKRSSIVYHLPIWRVIMWIIRHIPEAIFKRLRL